MCAEAAREQLAAERDWNGLADLLVAGSQSYGVSAAATARAELLRQGKAVAVVTGQQVGYLGGPLYTFLKAYHATRLAVEHEHRTGIPTLAIFWLEGEDHDLEEVRDAHYLTKGGEVAALRFVPERELPHSAVGRYAVRAAAQVEELAAGLDAPDEAAIALLHRCYDDATLADGLGRLLAATLGPRGLLLVEGSDARLKALARPLWNRVLARGPELSGLLQARSEQLAAAGYPAPIHPSPENWLFYVLDELQRRTPLSYAGQLHGVDGGTRELTLDGLRERVEAAPERISPKAALRPLYQDFVLPTVAYVAGPGELSYHMQLAPFYRELGVAAPSLIPRFSATIQDAKTARVCAKLELGLAELLREPEHVLQKQVLRGADDGRTVEVFAQAKAEIEAALERVKGYVGEIDPTLAGAAAGGVGKILHPLEQLREKTDKALKQRHATSLTRLEKALNVLRGGGTSAERKLATGYYLARFGGARLLRALDELPLEPARHHLITME
ncbi:bacillithiol biosynthesis cysteine-adding enzyme BshC [candidate division KSB1 bacterium]|nr:bacillithiol biosynthesis cysteine-adding enzyme BshC [candidate division KSB1 bacterium]